MIVILMVEITIVALVTRILNAIAIIIYSSSSYSSYSSYYYYYYYYYYHHHHLLTTVVIKWLEIVVAVAEAVQ